MKRTLALFFALAALLVLGASSAQARGGALDPSFGGGFVSDRLLQGVGALLLLPDGKIFLAGSCCENRESPAPEFAYEGLNSDGSVTFGAAPASVSLVPSWGTAAVLLPSGKILVAGIVVTGVSEEGGFLARFNKDGSLDTSFGADGFSTFSELAPSSLFVQQGGKILVVGTSHATYYRPPVQQPEFALARFDGDGSLDTAFGTNGIVTTTFGGFDYVQAAAEQPDGGIVVVGFAGFITSGGGVVSQGVLVRYNPDGSVDKSFNGGLTGGLINRSILVQPGGKVLVGAESPGARFGGQLIRYNADGSPDYGFGTPAAPPDALALGPDGSIVAVGGGIARFHPDGTPDLSFGTDDTPGLMRIRNFGASTVAVQPDGKIIAAGRTRYGSGFVRLLPDKSQMLHVKRQGRGRGTIVSSPLGVECSKPHLDYAKRRVHGICTQLFERGSTVALTAQNTEGSIVTWRGACSGRKRVCKVQMNSDRTVVALFRKR